MNKLITEQKDIIRVLFILVKILQFFCGCCRQFYLQIKNVLSLDELDLFERRPRVSLGLEVLKFCVTILVILEFHFHK